MSFQIFPSNVAQNESENWENAKLNNLGPNVKLRLSTGLEMFSEQAWFNTIQGQKTESSKYCFDF